MVALQNRNPEKFTIPLFFFTKLIFFSEVEYTVGKVIFANQKMCVCEFLLLKLIRIECVFFGKVELIFYSTNQFYTQIKNEKMKKTVIPSETLIFFGEIWRTEITEMSIRVRHKVNYTEVFPNCQQGLPTESLKSKK